MSKLQERLNALKNKGLAPLETPQEIETAPAIQEDPEIIEGTIVEQEPEPVIDVSKLSLKERLALLKKNPSTAATVPNNVKMENKGPSLKDMGAALRAMPPLSEEDHEKAPAEVHSLRDRIWKLQLESGGDSLKDAMKHLQTALLENPTAVSFFLPEDYGEMVSHIRKLTGNAVAQALAKPAGKKSKAALPSTEVSLDDLSF